jgi:hypothetical protein
VIDLSLLQLIKTKIEQEFDGFYIGLQHDSDKITLPAVFLDVTSEAIVGGPLYKGNLLVHILTQADDQTLEEHSEIVLNINNFIKYLIVSSGDVKIFGIVPVQTNTSRAERHFQTSLTFVIGFGSNC